MAAAGGATVVTVEVEEQGGQAGEGGEGWLRRVGEMGRSRSISSFFWILLRVLPPSGPCS